MALLHRCLSSYLPGMDFFFLSRQSALVCLCGGFVGCGYVRLFSDVLRPNCVAGGLHEISMWGVTSPDVVAPPHKN